MMTKKPGHEWTSEQLQFLKDNCYGITTLELTNKFNKHFSLELEHSQIYCKKKNLKLGNGINARFIKGHKSYPRGCGYQHYLTKEQEQFLRDNILNNNYDLAMLFNQKFGTNLTARKIYGMKNRHGVYGAPVGGQAQRFKTGYKKGTVSIHRRAAGTKRICNCRAEIKTENPAEWISQGQYIWEQVNGKVPKGHVIIHLDKNPFNNTLENLQLVSRAELVRINQKKLFVEDAELNKTACIIAKIITAAGRAKRKEK